MDMTSRMPAIEVRYLNDPAWRWSLREISAACLQGFDLAFIKRLYDQMQLQAIQTHRFSEFTIWTGPKFMPKHPSEPFALRFTVKMQFSSSGNCFCSVRFYPGDQMENPVADTVRGRAIELLCGDESFTTLYDLDRFERGLMAPYDWAAWQVQNLAEVKVNA